MGYPGNTKGCEHRIGGLEKTIKGTVSYIPENHEYMTEARAKKVESGISKIPDLKLYGEKEGDMLLVGWGGTYGHLLTAAREMIKKA